ncbi:glycosyltransferase family 2 protein [Flavobacterium nackdongense]|uniref:Glycosyltransferase family 2 protein n=1 Tax=Flavobacterium nackdongense TaxID=2547394 RepID=A0A4P6Y9S9_9FLAO|nr:glycosyltransferase family 2 protein [Flavobacterium nackdongense]QBN19821.1 glycosyltransferase family 2 protein [Flavobacterium nackdongense]
MKSILGVVITFNPNLELLKENINSFINSVNEVVIIDNGSMKIEGLLLLESSKIRVISNKSNIGIAAALNQAILYAQKSHFDYMLTMDQDSYFESSTLSNLLLGFKIKNAAIICPNIKDMNSNQFLTLTKEYTEIFTTITSGSLCKVDKLIEVGGFDSKMFIDYVDFELCLRLQKNGYKIFRCSESILCHHLGKSKIYNFLGIKIVGTNHSPIRRFYYARNKIYIYKKYFFIFPIYVLRDVLSFMKTILIILCFEKLKTKKIKMILKGIWKGTYL